VLEITNRKREIRRCPLSDGAFVLGRNPTCDVHIADGSLSRNHARFIVNKDSTVVEDMGSTNGTWVGNDRLSKPVAVTPEDVVKVGDLEIRVFPHAEDQAEEPAENAWVQILNTNMRGKSFHLAFSPALVGRTDSSTLRLHHATISRIHAIFRYSKTDGHWVLEDRNSANGTYLDGALVSTATLTGGEKIRFGDVETVFLGNKRPAPREHPWLLLLLVALLGIVIAYLLADILGLVVE
jgi:pSer/pThr/pTyr-binding forkhead associated (FHA) protein